MQCGRTANTYQGAEESARKQFRWNSLVTGTRIERVDMETTRSSHVVVIGAGIGGLLAARVVSEFFDRVTVVERDALPDTPRLDAVCRRPVTPTH